MMDLEQICCLFLRIKFLIWRKQIKCEPGRERDLFFRLWNKYTEYTEYTEYTVTIA